MLTGQLATQILPKNNALGAQLRHTTESLSWQVSQSNGQLTQLLLKL